MTRRLPTGSSREKGWRFDAATGLLLDIDRNFVRLRSSQEGRSAIEAIRRAVKQMQAAGIHRNEKYENDFEYDKRMWYDESVDAVQMLEGLNGFDKAIGNTFRIRLNIR